jgi:hypothetical protein
MARDLELIHVDTNWHTTSNTNFHHENNGIMTLIIIGYHWQQHFWNIWKIAYIPIIFQALCGPWILDGSTALRDNDFPNFPLRLGIPRETRVHLPCPREMLRPPVQGGSASNPNMYPLVVKPGDRKSCFYSWLSYWNIGFSRPGYAIGGCTCQKLDYRWS